MRSRRLRLVFKQVIVGILVFGILYGLAAWLLSRQITSSQWLALQHWLNTGKFWFACMRWCLYLLLLTLWIPLVSLRTGHRPLTEQQLTQVHSIRRRLVFWLLMIELLILFL